LHFLGKGWALQVHHSLDNEHIIRAQLEGIPVQFVSLSRQLHTHKEYNLYLKSPSFWKRFEPECKILIFNTDTVLLGPGINEFLQ
jgi:hypothetical protein